LLVGMCRRNALRGRRDGATIRDAWSLPRTRARPEEPQPSIEGESWKEGEGVERDAGAGRGHKKTAAQRLSTTLDYRYQPGVRAPIDAGNLVADNGKIGDYRY
jgi:hypothetical protein